MDLNEYSEAALKTESVIEEVNTNKDRLLAVLEILIGAGNMLDALKKNIFYGKEIDNETFFNHSRTVLDGVHSIEIYKKGKGLEKIDQNALVERTVHIDPRIFHGVIGMATESTEMIEALVTYIKTGELDEVNLAEECGDSDWYEAILLDALDQDWSRNMGKNIKKLKKRYEDKFNSEQAINRDLDGEREILEQSGD